MNRIRSLLLTSVSPVAFATNPVRVYTPPNPNPTYTTSLRAAAQMLTGTVDGDEIMKRSPDSAAMLDYWDKVDAIVGGHAAMKKACNTYMPKFPNETADMYKLRTTLTKFTNVYRDVVETLASKPFEQEVSVDEGASQEILDFAENVDGAGNNLTQFASKWFFNGINSAIDWVQVDMPVADPLRDPRTISVAEAKLLGRSPYWSHVLGRNVLWATAEMVNRKETLTFFKVYEPGSPDRVRIFTRDPGGVVSWQLFEKLTSPLPGHKTSFAEIDNGTISIGVIPFVPFITGRRDGRTFMFDPALNDAVDLQIELFQQESGLKFTKTMAGYSMLAGNGVKPERDASGKVKDIAIGPMQVLYAPPNGEGRNGSWVFIQPDPAVMKFLADDVKETISQLRELGRLPLTAQSGNLTVISASAAAGKAKSVVGAWAYGLKDAIELALVYTCMFTASGEEPEVNVYTEFDEFTEGKDVEALTAARYPSNGSKPDITAKTFRSELKRRGVLSANFDEDEEEKNLLAELPSDGADATLLDNPPPTNPVVPPVE